MTNQRRTSIIAIAIAGLAVLLLAGYGAWWQVLAARTEAGLAKWAAAPKPGGWTVSTGAVAATGFPGTIRLTLAEPKAENASGDAWAGPPLVVEISPFDPATPRFIEPGDHRVTLAGHPLEDITAATLTGHVVIADRQPQAVIIDAGQVAGAGLTLDKLSLDLHRDAPNIVLAAEIDKLTLPAEMRLPLDRTISVVHLAARLTHAPPPGPVKTMATAWRDGGGTLELDSIDLGWPPVSGAGNATLALDPAMQPEMAGAFTFRGLSAAVDIAAKTGAIKPTAATVAKFAIALASKKAADGVQETKIAVTVQKRTLMLGAVPLIELPEVVW